MLLIDGHEDIAWNILTFGRNYHQSAFETRRQEEGSAAVRHNGNTLLGLPEWLSGEVALIFATIFMAPKMGKTEVWDKITYNSDDEAYMLGISQISAYRQFIDQAQRLRLVTNQQDFKDLLDTWDIGQGEIGFILLMEGADPITSPESLAEWYEMGLRIVGPAWAETKYSGSAYDSGPLKPAGKRLLSAMDDFNMILDLSHLSERSFFESVERYQGTVIVSHANTRRFLPSERGLTEDQVRLVAERDGVIGVVPYNRFLLPGWQKGDPREQVTLHHAALAVDHICQLTGSSDNVAIGTDFDGGFGLDSVPQGIDTIADIQKLCSVLSDMGYHEDDIKNIFHQNWLRILRRCLLS